jgi:hypothetical protein
LQGKNWLEVARKLFCLVSTSLIVSQDQDNNMSGGLDSALGDYVGNSPLSLLGPTVVLSLVGGASPQNPLETSAGLPLVMPTPIAPWPFRSSANF